MVADLAQPLVRLLPMALNDCFAITDRLLSLDEALAFIGDRVTAVTGTETVPLRAARGRILAEPVTALVTQPSFANSAMDGFAARFADLSADGPTSLPVIARIAAGHPLKHVVDPGQAVEIFTGAPLPEGVDTVIMVEDCTLETAADGSRRVTVPAGLKKGNFVRPAGEDFSQGTPVLPAGLRLRPQDVAMAAAAGHAYLTVRKRLRVGVFSTGDEVIEPGSPLGPAQIYGSNRYGQMAIAEAWGHEVVDLGHLPDDHDAITRALAEASQTHDAILTSGGVSLGGEDHVKNAVEANGELFLWRLALKPGKPVALGTIGNAAFIGLPGYPVSALVTLMVVGRAVLDRLAGASALPPMPTPVMVRAGFTMKKNHPRRMFMRGSLTMAGDGTQVLQPYRTQESSVLSSLVDTGGLIDIPAESTGIAEGDLLPFLSYESLLR